MEIFIAELIFYQFVCRHLLSTLLEKTDISRDGVK